MLHVIKRITPQIGLCILLLLVCSISQLFELKSLMRFDRELIASGEWWLLLSANFVHLNLNHYLLNMAGLLIVLIFFANQLRLSQWLLVLLVCSLSVTAGMYWFNPEVGRYVGLSGVLHGLFVAGALTEIRRFPVSGWLLSAGLILKLIWEQTRGAMPGSEDMIQGRVMVDSHLYGALSAAILMSMFYLYNQIVFHHQKQ